LLVHLTIGGWEQPGCQQHEDTGAQRNHEVVDQEIADIEEQ
jgi:hypothetical protein